MTPDLRPQPGPETLRAVADIIDAEPERYNQSWWAMATPCGTVACIAGHALLVHYGRCALDDRGIIEAEIPAWRLSDVPPVAVNDNGEVQTSHVAAHLLGVDAADALLLFAMSWRPRVGLTVAKALYAIADGATVASVTKPEP